ncbi:MAG: site-2 protease family protein [Candidatus Micrarchaeia archaeon]
MDELQIGEIFGIKINLHITFIFLIAISAIFGLTALLFLFLLFGSVFLHELSHSISAKNNGLHVKKILLLPLGGLSEIKENEIPSDIEIKVALVGPVFNLFLSFLSAAFASISIPPFATLFQYLFMINLLLGVSNLIPAFPFDGGKVFRGVLSKKLNFFEATNLVKKLGDFIIIMIFFISVLWSFFANDFSFLIWNLLIILMVYEAGSYEVEIASLRMEFMGVTVKEALEKRFIFIDENKKVSNILQLLKKHYYILLKIKNSFYVVDPFLIKDKEQKVKEVAKEVPTITKNSKLFNAIQALKDFGVLVVLDKRRVIGLVTPLSVKLLRLKIKNNK